jgi:hypothetical protein
MTWIIIFVVNFIHIEKFPSFVPISSNTWNCLNCHQYNQMSSITYIWCFSTIWSKFHPCGQFYSYHQIHLSSFVHVVNFIEITNFHPCHLICHSMFLIWTLWSNFHVVNLPRSISSLLSSSHQFIIHLEFFPYYQFFSILKVWYVT